MKVFVIQLLSIIFVVLITGSIQSVIADHLEPGKGIFKDAQTLQETEATLDSNYQIYLQTVLRNGDGHLISVTERMYGFVISHQVTDHVFDTLMGKKEIVTIDNIKYEKVQYTFSPTLVQRTVEIYPIFEEIPLEQFTIYDMDEDTIAEMKENIKNYFKWRIHYCATFEGHAYTCIPVFQGFTTVRNVASTDVVTHQWTILRVLD
tara:strand:+ start:101 stop:715 length:615 start_codon:yes stop_codon:yes gene_type:complete